MKGFTVVNTKSLTIKHRIVLALAGHPKSGKSHFALTAPGPIAYLDLDAVEPMVLAKFMKGKQIFHADHSRPVLDIDPSHDDHIKRWKEFRSTHETAVKDPKIRTIIWDTATEVWEMCRLKHFGALSKKSHHYGPPNAEMLSLIRMVKEQSDKNFIMLQQMTEIYENDMGTGRYGPAGFKQVPYQANVIATAYHDVDEMVEDDDASGFWIELGKGSLDMGKCGEVLEPPMNDFANLASLMHGVKPSNWK